jgi:hypothetical protein
MLEKFKRPTLGPNDIHIVVADSEQFYESSMKIFDAKGNELHKLRCLAKGVNGADFSRPRADTPPGLYKLGTLYTTQSSEPAHVWRAFGKYFLDMEGQEQNEEKYGRAGCGLHGGGSGSPSPLAPDQGLYRTWGCVRVLNRDLENIIVPLYQKARGKGGTVWMTVYQY